MATTIYYTVCPRDTLWNIAKKFDTTVNDIARYNGITNPDLIYPGQTLRIPQLSEEKVPEWYVIRDGDTLWTIAEKFGITVDQILALNDIPNPDMIYPRRRIRLRP